MDFDFNFLNKNKYSSSFYNDISDEEFENLNKKFISYQDNNISNNSNDKKSNEILIEYDTVEKKKRDHIRNEKKRRLELNNHINKMKDLLDCKDNSKADVLKKAGDEIIKLRKLNYDLKEEKEKLKLDSLLCFGLFNKEIN